MSDALPVPPRIAAGRGPARTRADVQRLSKLADVDVPPLTDRERQLDQCAGETSLRGRLTHGSRDGSLDGHQLLRLLLSNQSGESLHAAQNRCRPLGSAEAIDGPVGQVDEPATLI